MTEIAATSGLQGCDQEPIHIPGTIQPHGVLIIVDDELKVVQCSANVEALLGLAHGDCLESSLDVVIGQESASLVRNTLTNEHLDDNPMFLETVSVRGALFNLVLHKREGLAILELELTDQTTGVLVSRAYPLTSKSIGNLQQQFSLTELLDRAAREMQKLTNFDRILIYRFGTDWAGTVVAEARTERLPSYMDLRFPESDIPRQARELYRLNRVRLIANANYTPVPILPPANPLTGKTPDLTYSTLRSVSPVHVEYMKNMGTLASMSISIIHDGQLWGLIACHDHAPAHVPVQVRFACDLLAQVLSAQIAASVERTSSERRSQLQGSQQRLLTRMGQEEFFVDAIRMSPQDMLQCVGAEGAAILFEDRCEMIAQTPTETEIRELAAWIAQQPEHEVFASDELPRRFPASEAYRQVASGVLAVSISEIGIGYLLWFRAEKSAEVKWAGNPNKIEVVVDGRIHPRNSFQSWTEHERGRSQPWDSAEVESAAAFRRAVINLVLRKAQKLAALSASLQQSNAELEAFSYSVSHDLRAPFRHIIGYAEILREEKSLTEQNLRNLDNIVESANFAGSMVDNLLSFARIGRSKLNLGPVPMNALAEEVVRAISADNPERSIQWTVHDLPKVTADLFLLRLVLENLIRNAVKYTRPCVQAEIEISCSAEPSGHYVFSVKDNGVGFDMRYVDKLFGVFQRLHRMEEFEGTGIGLATVRRIIGRHGGRTWARGQEGNGATFFFSLPRTLMEN